MGGWDNQPTDRRSARRRSERTLIFAVVILFLVVGGVLIGLIYGPSALMTALVCLIPGVLMIVALWLVLKLADHLVGRDE